MSGSPAPASNAEDPAATLAPTPSLARRMACFVYEGVLLFGVVMAVGLVYGIGAGQRDAMLGRHTLQGLLFVVLGVYFTWFWSHGGQTVAMKTWHIRLVGIDGAPAPPLRCLARYLLAWLWFGDEAERMKVLHELFAALTPQQMDSDGKAYADFLLAQAHVMPGRLGVVGYCYTGQMAVRMAAIMPDRITAAASFHGGWLATDKPDSAHLLLPKVKARLYFGHADNDQLMPREWIDRLEAALHDWRGAFASEVYKGAAHGWTVPDRDGVYNALQAERAFEKEVELFDATLKA